MAWLKQASNLHSFKPISVLQFVLYTFCVYKGTACGTEACTKILHQSQNPVRLVAKAPPNPSSFKLLLRLHCKASLSQARNTAFIIICHQCSSMFINYLQLSQINGVNTAPLGGVPRPRFGAAAPHRGIGTLPTAAAFGPQSCHDSISIV